MATLSEKVRAEIVKKEYWKPRTTRSIMNEPELKKSKVKKMNLFLKNMGLKTRVFDGVVRSRLQYELHDELKKKK